MKQVCFVVEVAGNFQFLLSDDSYVIQELRWAQRSQTEKIYISALFLCAGLG